ncbi:MAG TPA: cysteine desulfurase family protein [Gammaproteobacteria bacterium]|nr:cysteine desulfurase family protein [Gammaproteobacteria bacterium]
MDLYLDYNATVPPHPEVREVMDAAARERWGNPQSVHAWGRRARAVVEDAREQVAALVGCAPRQVTFTSGATEANNTVLKGRALAEPDATILVGAGEHSSVRVPARYLRELGFDTAEIPVDGDGLVAPAALERALRQHAPVSLVSVMWANNETGTLQPIAELAAVCAEHGVPLHSDAVQAAGKVPVDWGAGVAALSLSAHKLGGPQGVGALVRDDEVLALDPLLHGGGHERDRRAGTENVAGIAGFGRAAELARRDREAHAAHTRALRNRLEARLSGGPAGAEAVSAGAERLPNTSCLLLPGVAAETLLMRLDLEGIAVSSGSACASGGLQPSAPLLAMGYDRAQAASAIRVSLGAATTADETERFAGRLEALAEQLRQRPA